MIDALFIVAILAIMFSLIALILGCVAIAMVSGFLRSTHTIQWKTLENPYQEAAEELLDESDPFVETKPKTKKPQDFAFMDDVADSNNF